MPSTRQNTNPRDDYKEFLLREYDNIAQAHFRKPWPVGDYYAEHYAVRIDVGEGEWVVFDWHQTLDVERPVVQSIGKWGGGYTHWDRMQ